MVTDADDTDGKLKREFAREWLKQPDNPYAAAYRMFPGDVATACASASAWIKDPLVIAEMRRIRDEEPTASQLPTREELAQRIIGIADNTGLAADERYKGYKLAADILGYIQKPGVSLTAGSGPIQSVMLVPKYDTESDFERVAKRQQAALIQQGQTDAATQH